jgi:hypothetical protein
MTFMMSTTGKPKTTIELNQKASTKEASRDFHELNASTRGNRK